MLNVIWVEIEKTKKRKAKVSGDFECEASALVGDNPMSRLVLLNPPILVAADGVSALLSKFVFQRLGCVTFGNHDPVQIRDLLHNPSRCCLPLAIKWYFEIKGQGSSNLS
jgi:hypothetical protein